MLPQPRKGLFGDHMVSTTYLHAYMHSTRIPLSMLEYLWYFLCTEGVVMLNYSVYSKISIVSRLCAPKHVLQSRQMSIVVFHHEL
jgi:hypothetical protein